MAGAAQENDLPSECGCAQWEYREWKYQKMSEVGGLAYTKSYRFSGGQSSRQEQYS